jgi:hypothetical protein
MGKVRDHEACEEEIAALRADLTTAVTAERERILASLKWHHDRTVPGVARKAWQDAIEVVMGTRVL